VSLRRRFLLLFALYLLIGAIGAGAALRIAVLRDEQVDREHDAIEQAELAPADRAELEAARDELDDLRRQLNIVIAVTVAAGLLTTVWATRTLRWSVLRPLDRVGAAVRNVRAGARHTTVPTTGPAEISRLARDVEDLRRRLNVQILEAVRAREAVEESASVLLSLRSQLEPEVAELPGDWTVAAHVQPAEGVVAGDCYDLLRVSPSRLGMIVVDISGHGAISGIIALRCRELLRAALRNGLEPGGAIEWARAQLDDLGDEQFLSAFVAVADLATGALRFANAGHPSPLACARDRVIELEPTGPIVGAVDGGWRTALATLAPGDTLAIYTDGLVEVRGDEGEEFGLGRLVQIVCGSSSDEADQIAKSCLDEVAAFGAARIRDDATIVLLCRGPREARPVPRLAG